MANYDLDGSPRNPLLRAGLFADLIRREEIEKVVKDLFQERDHRKYAEEPYDMDFDGVIEYLDGRMTELSDRWG